MHGLGCVSCRAVKHQVEFGHYCQCHATTSMSVHEPSMFMPSQEFGTPYYPLFVTVSHSLLRRNLKTLAAQLQTRPHSYQKLLTDLQSEKYFLLSSATNLMCPQSNCPPTEVMLSDVLVHSFGIASQNI